MKEDSLPEEKLLKLIRGQKSFPSQTNKIPLNDIELKKKSLAIKETLQRFTFINLPTLQIQRILLVIFILSCFYLAGSFIYPLMGLISFKMPTVKEESFKEPDLNIEIKPYEFYLNSIAGRQIFKSIASSFDSSQTGENLNNVDAVKDINLIGVVKGEGLQAIVEDKKNQKTYYLTKGQSFGEFQVEEIEETKVIVNYKGKRFELYL